MEGFLLFVVYFKEEGCNEGECLIIENTKCGMLIDNITSIFVI